MERDRAGIILSNVLRQVRGRVHQNDQLGTIEYLSRGFASSSLGFFKTSTNQINYKTILGFDLKREDEEENVQQAAAVGEDNNPLMGLNPGNYMDGQNAYTPMGGTGKVATQMMPPPQRGYHQQ